MTKKEIEDYINRYRTYPQEYTGKRDKRLLTVMYNSYRYDVETHTVTQREGYIDSNGDFKLGGLYQFPIDNPDLKVEITDEIEKTTILHSNYTVTKFKDLMRELNHDSGYNENWTLRDMVAEIDYLRTLYYTPGHERNKLKTEDPKKFKHISERLQYWIRKYKDQITGIKAYTTHNSKYD